MAVQDRLTDKKMANRRFRRTEEAILRAFFAEDYYVSPARMARKLGIARSTIYHHHGAIRNIVPDYKRYLMRQYRKAIFAKMKRSNISLFSIYGEMLIFVLRHKMVIKLLLKNNDKELLERMVRLCKPKAMLTMRMSENYDRVYNIYAGEVVALLCDWIKRGVLETEMAKVLEDITYLTKTAKVRLSGVK